MPTPTTPLTPHFPLFETSPIRSPSRDGRFDPETSSLTEIPFSRRVSTTTISLLQPSHSPAAAPNIVRTTAVVGDDIPIIRPLPIRPATGRKLRKYHVNLSTDKDDNRVSKPHISPYRQHRRSFSYQFAILNDSTALTPPTPPSSTLFEQQKSIKSLLSSSLSPRSFSCTRLSSLSRTKSFRSHPPRRSLQRNHDRIPSNIPTYARAVAHLATELVPLISVTTGQPHESFPRSILQYHLLTHAQLDELARYYHQVYPPVRETEKYPIQIPAWVRRSEGVIKTECCGEVGKKVSLETKRRRWGRFLGLQGCESPVEKVKNGERKASNREEGEETSDTEPTTELLDREWRRALENRREEERMRDKAEGWRYRW